MRRWIDVATLTKTRNLDGSFVARAATGLPFLLEQGMHVSFVPPQTDVPREAVVHNVVLLDDGRCAEVSFSGIDDIALAKQMVGVHCIVERDAVHIAEPVQAPALINGFSVIDENAGYLGFVRDIIENPGQSLLEVQRAEEPGTEAAPLLIPLVDAFILDVDFADERVFVSIPDGLLEL